MEYQALVEASSIFATFVVAFMGLIPREAKEYPLLQGLLFFPFVLFVFAVLLGVADEPIAYLDMGVACFLLIVVFAYAILVNLGAEQLPPPSE